MNNHSSNLNRSVLVLSGIVGGLAVATTLVSCAGDTVGTVTEPAPTTDQTDQSQIRQNTATPEQPPATVVVYDNGTGNSEPENTDNAQNPPIVETEDTDEAPVVEVPADDGDTVDGSGDPVDDGEPGGVEVGTVVEFPTDDDDEAPVFVEVPTDDDGPVVVVPEWLDVIEKHKSWELIDICDKYPQLCEDEEILVELPESCDPDEGTCPGWVIDDLIETFESFNFGHSPIEKVGTQPLITKWTPTGP